MDAAVGSVGGGVDADMTGFSGAVRRSLCGEGWGGKAKVMELWAGTEGMRWLPNEKWLLRASLLMVSYKKHSSNVKAQ